MILKYDGRYGGIQDSQDDVSSSTNNMLANLNSSRGDNITRNGKGRFFVTVNPIKDLSVTGSMVYEYTSNNTKVIPIFNDFWNFATNSIILKGGGQTYISQSTCYPIGVLNQVAGVIIMRSVICCDQALVEHLFPIMIILLAKKVRLK